MKFVVSSDWHGDHRTHGVDRFPEIRDAVHVTVDVAIEEKADAYFFLGDLCDPDSGSTVFRTIELAISAAERCRAAGIPSIWLAGNHDVIEDGSGDTTLSPLRAIDMGDDLVQVVESPRVVTLLADDSERVVHVACLPFCATSRAYVVEEKLAEMTAKTSKQDVVVIGHLSVPGVQPGEETTDMPRGREVTLPTELARERAALVMNGHYHRQQKTESGVWIPGSLARLTFGEEGHEPGYLVVEVP